ncbi:MAG: ArnT family glycosyltransferase, partial [Bacteroidota bacterium]
MPSLIFQYTGTALLLLLAAAWSYSNHKHRLSVVLVLGGGLLLRLVAATLSPELFTWDEQFHALAAKHLMQTPLHPRLYPEYLGPEVHEYWMRSYTWLHKPPLTMWLGALSMKVFGVSVFAYRLPFVLLSTATLLLQYLIVLRLAGERAGFAALWLLTFSQYVLLTVAGAAGMSGLDTTLVFTTSLGLWAWLRWEDSGQWRWALLLGLACGLGVLTKWLVGLLPLCVAGLSLLLTNLPLFRAHQPSKSWQPWAQLVAAVSLMLILAAPWYVYAAQAFPESFATEMSSFSAHFTRQPGVVQDQHYPWYVYLITLPRLYAWPLAVLLPIALLAFFRSARNLGLALVCLATLIAVYGFFMLADWRIPHYVVLLYPLMLALFGALVARMQQSLQLRLSERHARNVTLVLLLTLSYMMLKPAQWQTDLQPPMSSELRQLFQRLPRPQTVAPVVFGADQEDVPRLMFHSGWIVVRDACDSRLAERLLKTGRNCWCLRTINNRPQLEPLAA